MQTSLSLSKLSWRWGTGQGIGLTKSPTDSCNRLTNIFSFFTWEDPVLPEASPWRTGLDYFWDAERPAGRSAALELVGTQKSPARCVQGLLLSPRQRAWLRDEASVSGLLLGRSEAQAARGGEGGIQFGIWPNRLGPGSEHSPPHKPP